MMIPAMYGSSRQTMADMVHRVESTSHDVDHRLLQAEGGEDMSQRD